MKQFAQLLELLALTPSRNRKLEALVSYFRATPDPDRGYALAILTGALTFKNVKPAVLRDVVTAEGGPILVGISYDYLGDRDETAALWGAGGPPVAAPASRYVHIGQKERASEIDRVAADAGGDQRAL